MTKDVEGAAKWRPFGKLAESGKIDFDTSENMWAFLKKYKGKKFTFKSKELFHKVDQTKAEQDPVEAYIKGNGRNDKPRQGETQNLIED